MFWMDVKSEPLEPAGIIHCTITQLYTQEDLFGCYIQDSRMSELSMFHYFIVIISDIDRN